MGSSRAAGARLYSFLADAQARGPVEALRTLNLEALAGRPIEEIFLGLAEFIHKPGPLSDNPAILGGLAGVYKRCLEEVGSLLSGVRTRPS